MPKSQERKLNSNKLLLLKYYFHLDAEIFDP